MVVVSFILSCRIRKHTYGHTSDPINWKGFSLPRLAPRGTGSRPRGWDPRSLRCLSIGGPDGAGWPRRHDRPRRRREGVLPACSRTSFRSGRMHWGPLGGGSLGRAAGSGLRGHGGSASPRTVPARATVPFVHGRPSSFRGFLGRDAFLLVAFFDVSRLPLLFAAIAGLAPSHHYFPSRESDSRKARNVMSSPGTAHGAVRRPVRDGPCLHSKICATVA
jgi:hypothetical protein